MESCDNGSIGYEWKVADTYLRSVTVRRPGGQRPPMCWKRRHRWRCSSSNRALAALALALTANALSICNVFPYAPFQVKFFGLTEDDRELGFYAGFLMTAYMIGNGMSAIPWGAFSDRYGKRCVIMIGMLANTAPQIGFGVSRSMPMALLARFIMGVLNGVVGAAKALAPEMVPPSEQAAAMSMIAGTWGLGNLIGPALGGLLSLWGDECEVEGRANCAPYPFLLPNLVCALMSLVGLAAVARFIPNDRQLATPALTRVAPPIATHEKPTDGAAEDEGDTVVLRVGASSSTADAAAGGASSAKWAARRTAALTVGFYGCIALTVNGVGRLILPGSGRPAHAL